MTTICPNLECGQIYRIKHENIGTIARCKKCGTKFKIAEYIQKEQKSIFEFKDEVQEKMEKPSFIEIVRLLTNWDDIPPHRYIFGKIKEIYDCYIQINIGNFINDEGSEFYESEKYFKDSIVNDRIATEEEIKNTIRGWGIGIRHGDIVGVSLNLGKLLNKYYPDVIDSNYHENYNHVVIETDINMNCSKINEIFQDSEAAKIIFGAYYYICAVAVATADLMNEAYPEPYQKKAIDYLEKAKYICPSENLIKECTTGLKGVESKYYEFRDAQKTSPQNTSGCFIATAVYGDILAPEVVCLRQYRDTVLNDTKAGRIFIMCYYFISSPLAQIISNTRMLKRIIRKYILDPVVSIVKRHHTNL